MTNIMIRLSTRIEKLKAEGIDTTNAELKLAQANTSLSSARATLESIESAPRAMSGDTPRAKYTTMRAQFLLVRDHLRTTQSQLLEVIAILKGSAVRNVEVDQDTATSSITSDVITN
jgi:multidrug resistance efflux pump